MRSAYQALREFAVGFFSFDTGSEFLAGFMSGLMVFALALLIALILYWLITASRRSKGVLLQAERGTVFIAARSISDLVKSLEADFAGLKIDKVSLRSRRSSTWLEVQMEFQPADGTALPQLLDSFQKKTLAELEASFGINSISEVKIRIGRVRPVQGSAIR
ncbi:MAG TPA: hypothetical protein DDZ11_06990 [Lentisphaeria bacterium]|nr:hypothetical protein [Lentisphaeria bacterium]